MLSMSMTVDTAIRIDYYSAELVQLYPQDMFSLVCSTLAYATSTSFGERSRVHDKAFTLHYFNITMPAKVS